MNTRPVPGKMTIALITAQFILLLRLSENAHLPFDRPFDRLMALSKAEGLRYPHPPPC